MGTDQSLRVSLADARRFLLPCLPKSPFRCLWTTVASKLLQSLWSIHQGGGDDMLSLDPLNMVWLVPRPVWAVRGQWGMQHDYRQGKAVAPTRRITGAQAAAEVLQFAGITGVAIEPGKGILTDHYDARYSVLRLRPDVYYGQSLTALGLAAHEAGHALQDATGYPLLGLRNGLVPLASLGSYISWFLILTGRVIIAL